MKNRLLTFTLLLLCLPFSVMSQNLQEFRVDSFDENPLDRSATDPRYEIIDGNGENFSIVKVTSDDPDDNLRGYSFDFGMCESRVKFVDGELWVYVQRNAMHVTIRRDGYAPVKNHDLGITVQPGRVYNMSLQVAPKKVYKQMVLFRVSPADVDATVMYKREDVPGAQEEFLGQLDNGELSVNLELGKYSYRVVSKNYHAGEGFMQLENTDITYNADVELRPKFSRITLNADTGADIYIDGVKQGTGSWNGILNAGSYNIECRKASHRNGAETINVKEGENVTVRLKELVPIVGALSLISSPSGAAITIDGKEYGKTPRNINSLLIGEHTVTVSKEGYVASINKVEIKEDGTESLTVTLSEKPRTGTLSISSTPTNAEVKIDGKRYGTTPFVKDDLALGKYKVEVSKSGYRSATRTVDLGDNGAASEHFTLQYKVNKAKRAFSNISDWGLWNWLQFGLNASVEAGTAMENDTDISYMAGVGAMIRIGSHKTMFSMTAGAKYQYSGYNSSGASQLVFPVMVNWNMYRESDWACYIGLGYEGGILYSMHGDENAYYDGNYADDILYPSYFVMSVGGTGRHWDWNAYYKLNGYVITVGTAITWFF